MKIALVNLTTTTQFGGVETFVRELARTLADVGDDVTIFGGAVGKHDLTPGPSPSPAQVGFRSPTHVGAMEASLPAGGWHRGEATPITIHYSPYVSRDMLRRVPLLARQYGGTKLLERLSYAPFAYPAIARGGFDIVHIHKPYDFPLAAAVKRTTTAKVVYSSHGRDFWLGDRRFLAAIDAMTACSAYNAGEVRERYGRDATVIYNGIPIDSSGPPRPDAARRMSLDIGDAPLILWAGRLVRWKGTIDALRALALMRTPAHLLIAGSGPEEGRLRDAARAIAIAERVHFLGAVPHAEMGSLYALADCVIGTSFANETFGITLAEASAAARPVVATDFGGFREVIKAGETGLFVPPRDPAALAATLDALLSDPACCARMGQAGRRYVAAMFAWPAVAARVRAVYEQVLHA